MVLTICHYCGAAISTTRHICNVCGKRHWIFRRDTHLTVPMVVLGIIFALVLTYMQVRYDNYIYASYQPARCLIQSKSVSTTLVTSKYGTNTYYSPDFTYDVQISNGQHEIGYSYTEPDDTSFSNSDDAQNISDSYQIGTTYNCWYSAVRPTAAALVLRSDTDAKGIVGFFVYNTLFILAFLILYKGICRPWYLIKKGSRTYGKVIRYEQRYTKAGSYTLSILAFETATDPPLTYECIKHRKAAKEKKFALIYDPLYPQYNVVVEEQTSRVALFFRCMGLLLLVGVIVVGALLLF